MPSPGVNLLNIFHTENNINKIYNYLGNSHNKHFHQVDIHYHIQSKCNHNIDHNNNYSSMNKDGKKNLRDNKLYFIN